MLTCTIYASRNGETGDNNDIEWVFILRNNRARKREVVAKKKRVAWLSI